MTVLADGEVVGRRINQLTATFRARVGLDVVDQDPVLLAAVEKA